MVDDYLSEEEQAEAVKNWWKENWAWIISGIALGLAILFGWQYYQRYKTTRAEAAAVAYQQYANAVAAKDATKIDSTLKTLEEQYSGTAYVDHARLLQARNAVEAGKFDAAATALRNVADHSKDAELATIARTRLARVLIQQGKSDDALALLNVETAGAFAAQIREIRGDAYFAKGETDKAREEYRAALSASSGTDTNRSLLELKLQDLGDAAAPAAPAAAEKKS